MPKWGYSVADLDTETIAKASGRELRVSVKLAREVCTAIKGMKLEEAKEFLRQVQEKKKAVPFRSSRKKLPHRRGLEKIASGRYPVNAAKNILRILESAESNALYKGLDTEQLRVIHAAAYPGMKIKRYMPRAMGRATPRFETLCHIEIVLGSQGGKS
ncbi:MAG: 50S ribosomal protein L22 [Nitrososphaerota archaeon]|nr:50S ribosomal protein L22 [Candidatus Bathyarchaeota archaeon]MDW8048272.1 50S ribosomal protein L22 [Nitrososphaerota archaeon]